MPQDTLGRELESVMDGLDQRIAEDQARARAAAMSVDLQGESGGQGQAEGDWRFVSLALDCSSFLRSSHCATASTYAPRTGLS